MVCKNAKALRDNGQCKVLLKHNMPHLPGASAPSNRPPLALITKESDEKQRQPTLDYELEMDSAIVQPSPQAR